MKSQKPKKKKREGNFVYDFVKFTGAIPAVLSFRVKKYYINKNTPKKFKGGVILAPNHVSFVDPVIVSVVGWYRRLYYLATMDLFDTKLKSWFFSHIHCIPVDKQNVSVASLHAVCDRLKEGKAVVIFPEGKVNRDEEKVEEYKTGAILMAHISKKPIVPMYIVPGKRWYNRREIVIGEPIDVNALCGPIPTMCELDKACKILYEKELELREFYNDKNKKKGKKEND